ncbi:MAG: alpha/beta hydrolase [Alistipes sp.]
MKKSLLLTTTLLWCLCAVAQSYTIEREVPYRNSKEAYTQQRCRVDVAHKSTTKAVPVVVWFHGGGLTGGDRFVPNELLTKDYVIVAVGYRLSPHVSVSEIIDDAAAAVAWTFDNVARYGGDPSKIYLAGHSAGGYLVDMVGLNRAYLAKYGFEADSLAGIIPFSGQAITHFEQRRCMGMNPTQPLIDTLAPLYYVRGNAAPMLIVSGDREQELYGRYEETAYFWRMLKLAGHKDVTFYELDGFNHGDMCGPAYDLLLKFIDQREK